MKPAIRLRLMCIVGVFVLAAGILSCSEEKKEAALFRQISSDHSNLHFRNTITETDTFNVLNFEYIYNGAGLGVGDVNGDGLLDVYFGGNMVSSRLYLNEGNFVFRDVTEEAGVATTQWCTGISMIDINQDGRLDIYVSTANPYLNGSSKDLFFINQGNGDENVPTFREMAEHLGLADSSYSTQSAFLDYDLDGDLDMYLVTNAMENYVRSNPVGQHHDGSGKSVDKLYQNTGNDADGYPHFKDVSKEAGILAEGWGLGVVISDIDDNGYPDIYVANDFMANDHMYVNNTDGTFTDQSGNELKHQEMNGMGVDMADLNNDGQKDIVVVDMLPDDNLRQKTMFSDISYDRFQLSLKKDYKPQYVRNVLQLNNGNGTFSDIGFFSGIYATDWSWSPLIADFDNDGWRDIYITNGYVKDVTDLDFGVYAKDEAMFGTPKARLQKMMKAANELKGVDKPNLMFHNNGDLTFTNTAKEWGLEVPSYSNGAAYGDLDNDGDLDLITNDINGEPLLFENTCIDPSHQEGNSAHNFLRIKLAGPEGNETGIGASVKIYYDGKMQVAEQNLERGYKSTVEPFIHFGLGSYETVDSLIIQWPGFKKQKVLAVKANQLLTLEESQATDNILPATPDYHLFQRINTGELGIAYKHEEQEYADFKVTSLLPRKHSQQGPAICSGDINGDSRIDFIIGGAAHRSATVFLQTSDGTFTRQELPEKVEEDTGMLLFDADNDGDLDLYCVSGSSELGAKNNNYHDRLYRNDGAGRFTLDPDALPNAGASGSCVIGQDFDKDGDIDLFIGGRITPNSYPLPPDSYLLRNNGKGKFNDITKEVAPELAKAGMVTSALWTDYDNDGWTDLLVVGEFMPVTFYRNVEGKKFVHEKGTTVEESSGWWNSVTGGDFDNDGDTDYVLGNLGLNSIYQASPEEPVCVYAKDFDSNGSVDPILCRYIEGEEYPVHPRETLTSQIVGMKKILRTYKAYGGMRLHDLLSDDQLKDALILKATEFRSSYLENRGKDGFILHPLPPQAQFAPIFAMMTRDIDGDGNLDVLCVGNDYSFEPLTGYHDAGIGTCLMGDGKGNFKPMEINHSGFVVDKDAKAMVSIPVNGREIFLVTQNRDSLVAFTYEAERRSRLIGLKQTDKVAEVYYADGSLQRRELYLGDSYFSQTSPTVEMSAGIDSVVVIDSKDQRRTLSNDRIVSY